MTDPWNADVEEVARLEAEIERQASEIERLREALRQIAEPTPTSHRREVDQLRDAVKWRAGIARDALALNEKEPHADAH